jgi:cytochrome c peroxidase
MRRILLVLVGVWLSLFMFVARPLATAVAAQEPSAKHLFEQQTFGGNGRTCLTCHSHRTGTVSPEEAVQRFALDQADPLFVHDGSDDGAGTGVVRILTHATIRVGVPLAGNIVVDGDPGQRSIVLNRGIPTTLNTPALDPVLMLDGREPTLQSQALGAIRSHAQNTFEPTAKDLDRIAQFQKTEAFFSSDALRKFAGGGPAPKLPRAETDAERRGRRAFEDRPVTSGIDGICAACHSGPMLNETNAFLPAPLPPGSRFISALVSELNAAGNPQHQFDFTNPDGSVVTRFSPDPGRALITGALQDVNAFKISTLWGVNRTAPYFHDNSAKTLEQVMEHYTRFFAIVTDPDGPGPQPPGLLLNEQQKADILAFMRLVGQ